VKVANLKRLREVLIVVQRLETFGFEIRKLEVETLGSGEAVPAIPSLRRSCIPWVMCVFSKNAVPSPSE